MEYKPLEALELWKLEWICYTAFLVMILSTSLNQLGVSLNRIAVQKRSVVHEVEQPISVMW